jgi:L-glutamine:2-deoxy-scyllo-inosose/3-amino-2,3-dideoxy-scyllo-inosose aminotransferase
MKTRNTDNLALFGGTPVSRDPWPNWPQTYPETRRYMDDVLRSGVWAISGRNAGSELQCSQFRREFAEFTTRGWCVEVDHGTSALVTAFEALGVGPGDEVIVPVLTWVACASAVLQVGAVPVFVDADPDTLCMDVAHVEASVTERTVCVLVVHLNSSAVDMDAVMALAARRGLRVVEDCAQAHGAQWASGRMIGTHGDVAVYSFQNGKSLTAGEGGAVVGDDDELRRRVESARADTREISTGGVAMGEMYLGETGEFMGANYCLSEFGAAAVRAGLRHLPSQLERKHANAEALDSMLGDVGFRTVRPHPKLRLRSVYEYGVFLDGDVDRVLARTALTAELGTPVYEMDAPIHRSRLYRPETKPRFRSVYEDSRNHGEFPVAEDAHRCLAMIHHSVLLEHERRMPVIVAAFEKVRDALVGEQRDAS